MAKQTFTTGQVLTAAQQNSLQANDFNQTVSVKTANYSLLAADKGTRIEFNTSGSVTCTVNSGEFDAGDTLIIQNRGAGTATITAGTATVNTSASLALAQYSAGTLYFVSDSAAIFFGDAAGISASIVDAKGDLIVGTADNTVGRLAVGTNGYTLVADSSTATGLAYAAPAGSGALTLISRQTLSAAASVSFDGVFTSTYQAYICIIEDLLSSSQFNLDMRLKYSTNTEQTTGYYGTSFDGATQTDTSNGSAFRMSQGGISSDAGEFSNMHILFSPMNKSGRGVVSGFGGAGKTNKPISFMGVSTETRTYTGCIFFLSSGNMTGTFSMYGLAKS